MRILHVALGTSRKLGGPTTLLRGLLPVQRERGHEVTIVATDMGAETPADREVEGARARILPLVGPGRLCYGRGMRGVLREEVARADVVHLHGVYGLIIIEAMRAARRADVPYLVAPHGVWTPNHAPNNPALNSAWDRLLLVPLMKDAHRVVADSGRDAGYLRERGFERVTDMALGVDPALHLIDTPWPERRGVLFLSRVARKKRVDLAIEAYAGSRLWEQGHRLTVAGPIEPGLPYDPRELAARLGIAAHVDFVGAVEERERRELLARQRVFILASDDESFGIAVAEAASAGMAVVSSDRVVAMLDAEHDGAARTFPQDSAVLAKALRAAASDDGADAAATLRDYARARWTWEHAAQQIEEMVASPQTTSR
ncbi:glycosyltransferase [Demequina sp. SYSU T00192]|uniref:D-inositol 3-phosphate glycosyltransferase n=1 Tax=Demequina litoralis TaxID=3051660 RepID=A0ABT8G8C5_9MICO|nr:glycosyltransferase [Demequina sp. SYSU T00192]MDN4475406.1 glycosyltransferase [Demequina sp. SYSU T00192]